MSKASKSGWEEVSTSGSAPFVKWTKKGMVVEGIVVTIRDYTYKNKPHQAMEITDTKTGEVMGLPDSFALLPLFKIAKKGDSVRVTFLGKKKLKGKQTLNEFKVQRKAA